MSSVNRAAGIMGFATFLSRIMGLVREQVFAYLFGASDATDAFIIAFRIPNLLRDLFAEGAMSSALVPTFTRVRTEQGERRAWRVAGLVFRALFLFVTVIALLGMIFAPQLVALYASKFKEIPGKFELTVLMTRVLFPFFPLVALAAGYMGVLNACDKFFISGFASALFNLTSVIVGVVGAWIFPHFQLPAILGMAVGVVVGGAVQAFVQLPSLYSVGYRYPPKEATDLPWSKEPALRRMLILMIPGLVGLAATQINVLVNSVLATSQGPGAVSWLSYAFRLMQFPIGIFGVSMATAVLPRVSQQWVDRNPKGVVESLENGLMQILAVNLPASAGLAFLGYPIIEILFKHGRFGEADTHATAITLAAYSVGLAAYSAVKLLVPICYAVGNTRLPVISSVISVGVTIGLNLLLIKPFGYVGLALGTSFAAFLNALQLLHGLNSLLKGHSASIHFGKLAKSFFGYTLVSLAMGAICWFSYLGLIQLGWSSGHLLSQSLRLGALIFEGLAIVVILAKLFGLRELSDALEFILKKLKKKLRTNSK